MAPKMMGAVVAAATLMAVVMSSFPLTVLAETKECKLNTGKSTNNCDVEIKPDEILKIECPTDIKPNDLTAADSKVCDKAMSTAAATCESANQFALNSKVKGVTVQKASNVYTITAPATKSFDADVTAYALCVEDTHFMPIKMKFLHSSAFMASPIPASMVAVIASVIILSF